MTFEATSEGWLAGRSSGRAEATSRRSGRGISSRRRERERRQRNRPRRSRQTPVRRLSRPGSDAAAMDVPRVLPSRQSLSPRTADTRGESRRGDAAAPVCPCPTHQSPLCEDRPPVRRTVLFTASEGRCSPCGGAGVRLAQPCPGRCGDAPGGVAVVQLQRDRRPRACSIVPRDRARARVVRRWAAGGRTSALHPSCSRLPRARCPVTPMRGSNPRSPSWRILARGSLVRGLTPCDPLRGV